jgi:hypothetical protein
LEGVVIKLIEAFEKAIGQVVTDFQSWPDRYWTERDIHWNLLFNLRNDDILEKAQAIELIRAEFPTINKYGKRRARGHYDLVILEPISFRDPNVLAFKPWAPWDDFLSRVKLLIAVEVKIWVDRLNTKEVLDIVKWDIEKLTDQDNRVQNPYFLNFVQLDFDREIMKEYYYKLREQLADQKKQWPTVKILCVPSNYKVQSQTSDNWVWLK